MVNKVDRPAARPDWVIDQTFELFLDLGASDEQCGEAPAQSGEGVGEQVSGLGTPFGQNL